MVDVVVLCARVVDAAVSAAPAVTSDDLRYVAPLVVAACLPVALHDLAQDAFSVCFVSLVAVAVLLIALIPVSRAPCVPQQPPVFSAHGVSEPALLVLLALGLSALDAAGFGAADVSGLQRPIEHLAAFGTCPLGSFCHAVSLGGVFPGLFAVEEHPVEAAVGFVGGFVHVVEFGFDGGDRFAVGCQLGFDVVEVVAHGFAAVGSDDAAACVENAAACSCSACAECDGYGLDDLCEFHSAQSVTDVLCGGREEPPAPDPAGGSACTQGCATGNKAKPTSSGAAR